ncbi:hypothetical protein F5Y17DRAFT_151626 [Xylariaceae sp. FL0594]|nr:hypothetical protein F5Y17DRAFT_151626 [Xylariaceae sp. FL0594]
MSACTLYHLTHHFLVRPEEYGKAVRGYSRLRTGAGQNLVPLGEFLTYEPTTIEYRQSFAADIVVVYPLSVEGNNVSLSSSTSLAVPVQDDTAESDAERDSADEKPHRHPKPVYFHNANELYLASFGNTKPESRMLFLHGFMSATWINHIGARYFVDPEFFCRHLDFRPPDDDASNFSIPPLPSSSWHLIELPIFTIGTRQKFYETDVDMTKLDPLRKEGVEALKDHHHHISKLSSSPMSIGESMIRDFHVFDQKHFAVEQRISVCMQPGDDGKTFTVLVWLDAGPEPAVAGDWPWVVRPPESYLLPVIRHKHMAALKCHLFTDPRGDDSSSMTSDAQSALNLSKDYGRFLHPRTMSLDAFYSLNEVFNFAASSQAQFLNLLEVKLDQYTSLPRAMEYQSLPSLKFAKTILQKHIQKTRRVLDNIKSAQSSKWPRDRSDYGQRKTAAAAENLEQDFEYLLNRATALHQRTTESIAVLMSSISISESQKGINQQERLGKLTFLAFIFVPLSFTTSFFGMNLKELQKDEHLPPLWEWVALSIGVFTGAIALYHFDLQVSARRIWEKVKAAARA